MKTELAIIGAGPAGLAAAVAAADFGIEVTLIDEQARAGGQIYRQPPASFDVPNWLSDRVYRSGKALLAEAAERSAIQWLMGTSVLGVLPPADPRSRGQTLALHQGAGLAEIEAEQLLLAPGCFDMPVMFPGWTLPGVMATGGIQVAVKSQQLIPGERFVLAGTHPLQLIVADQLTRAGAEVAEVIFPQRLVRLLKVLEQPVTVLRHAGKFLFSAAALSRLRAAGVPVRFGEVVVRAGGDGVLERVEVAALQRNGTINRTDTREIRCDRLGVCFSFLVSSELARQRGARCVWSPSAGGWIARHNEWMRSSVEDMFVAGEITGVAGAEVAAEEGRLAAIGIALARQRIDARQAAVAARPVRRRLGQLGKFAALLRDVAYPGSELLAQLASDDSLLCKCEEVTVSSFRKALAENPHVVTANAAKLLTRVGMGYCQGRYCGYAATLEMARERAVPAASVGPFTARFPAKPVRIKDLLKG